MKSFFLLFIIDHACVFLFSFSLKMRQHTSVGSGVAKSILLPGKLPKVQGDGNKWLFRTNKQRQHLESESRAADNEVLHQGRHLFLPDNSVCILLYDVEDMG